MTVEVTRRAARDLDRIRRAQPVLFEKLVGKIRALARNPESAKALMGPLKGIWSLRVGDYRILYELAHGTVIVLTINHRREVYK